MASGAPVPLKIFSGDDLQLATYQFGDGGGDSYGQTVLAIHGFASSAILNWSDSGWVRDLTRAGFSVICYDQRGHGASDKPESPRSYTLDALVADAIAVLDTYMIAEVSIIGYSLGARVAWQAAREFPDRISRAVLGGIPAGDPLTTFRLDQAREFIANGTPIESRITSTYLTMASGIPGNDLTALVALVDGMRGGQQPDPSDPPEQPLLVATGSEDPVIDGSRMLAASAPRGEFLEIPGRHHFNAPTSRVFRRAAVAFLGPIRDTLD